MRSRYPLPRLILVALLGLGPSTLCGCYGGRYDESLDFHVRSDMLVNPNNNWEQQPTGFYHPGILPLDAVKGQHVEKETISDVENLKKELNKKIFDPAELSAEVRADYAKSLTEMFGKPAHPKVAGLEPAALKAADDSLTIDQITKALRLDETMLTEGSRLYRQECLHCHGLEGNGRGPTGYWVNPPPRDYRQGIFKFTSSSQDQNSRKPRREDLLHILQTGIEGTSMPSFALRTREELEALVSYVIFLSLRGEAEYSTMLDQLKDKKVVAILRSDLQTPTIRQALEDNLALAVMRWTDAQKVDKAILPDPYTYADTEDAFIASATRGARLFLGAGGCISCHQNYGREANLVYDSWGTIVRGRNLYDGIYRGGRRPIDLYYRIHGGINGAGMTAYKDINATIDPKEVGLTPEQKTEMKVDYLWDLVNFLKAMPYPDLRVKLRNRMRDQFKDDRVLIPD